MTDHTWPVLLDAPLLFVSFSFPKEISWRIQCAPVFGESGCMYTRFPEEEEDEEEGSTLHQTPREVEHQTPSAD